MDYATMLYGLAGLSLLMLSTSKLLDILLPNFEHIPTVGPSGRLTSYIGAIRFFTHGREMLQQGYYKYPNSIFKFPTTRKWEFIVSGPELINDLRKAGEDELSFHQASADLFQWKYTVKSGIEEIRPYDVTAFRVLAVSSSSSLLYLRSPEIYDELVRAFDDIVPNNSKEWTTLIAMSTLSHLIARVMNRVYIGLPECRNQEFLELGMTFAQRMFIAGEIINHMPMFLQPIVGWLVSPYEYNKRNSLKLLGRVIQEHLDSKNADGEHMLDGKPKDFLSYLIDSSTEEQLKPENLAMRVLFINFSAIHAASITLTHVLFDIAMYPEFIEPLREEVSKAIGELGWTKSATAKMPILDSFMRESLRINGLAAVSMIKQVVKPSGFTFSNGETLPPGATVAVPSDAIHNDPSIYSNPNKFDGFRTYRLYMDANDLDRAKYTFASSSPEYVMFGYGRHLCPGRYFSAYLLKTIISHVLLKYDIKLRTEGVRPANQWFSYACLPNRKGEIMFRQRC